MKQVQLIWEFRGPNAAKTAEHHALHLEEFALQEKIAPFLHGTEVVSPHCCRAYLVVPELYTQQLRTQLKPHRGRWYTPNNE
ncbi:hypothetical protein [Altibacter sp. HG106]|uniref:hypothetical protein n=1 Tax=Altibacter sp. HG106 TaxID=3023937 RepID=UPI00234FDC24|nr:hypothetical protein [Altibacter sp. HG106]MDC7996277.1 hypothetical protein [Altibacter sp. HG106]